MASVDSTEVGVSRASIVLHELDPDPSLHMTLQCTLAPCRFQVVQLQAARSRIGRSGLSRGTFGTKLASADTKYPILCGLFLHPSITSINDHMAPT